MRIDPMKAALGGAWLITLGAIAVSDLVVTAGSTRALLLAFGVLPVLLVTMFWAPPAVRLSESLAKTRN